MTRRSLIMSAIARSCWTLARGFGKYSPPRTYGHGGSTGTLTTNPVSDVISEVA